MYKVSEIISSPIISLYESEYQGTIYNIIFDCKTQKCKYIYLLNEEDNIEKIININSIYKVGHQCIFLKNASCIELKSNYDYLTCDFTSLINLPVYNLKGEKIGTSSDIELDRNFNIENIILNNNQAINKQNIINLGKSIILTNDIMVNITKFKPRLKPVSIKNEKKKVIILSKNNIQNTKENNTYKNEANKKLITDYRFLVGRQLLQDIKSINGEIIAKKGNIVSPEVIYKASVLGKLVEIARYSKKN